MTEDFKAVSPHRLSLKIVALFSVVRWYNIFLTILAQYISAFVFTRFKHISAMHVLLDFKLHVIVLASVFSIAAGFIINNFYDFEKDLINRPKPTLFHKIISKKTTLNLYIIFNSIALVIAFLASFKIGVFFFFFIFGLWLYSHKFQKLFFFKELTASILSVTSFFAILLHYNIYFFFIFVYGAFFMILIYGRELIKQFENYNGDLALNIRSMPVVLGLENAKLFIYFVFMIGCLLGLGIMFYEGLIVRNYFVLSTCLFYAISVFLIKRKHFKLSNLLFKIMIVFGILNLFTFLV